MSISKDDAQITSPGTPQGTTDPDLAAPAQRTQHLNVVTNGTTQVTLHPDTSDEAQQAWRQTRLRYPALGMCRR